jgi:Flp pilus assembly protein CpaB
MLSTATLPLDQASGTYQEPEELVGRVVRRTVLTGQPLTSADFETDVAVNLGQSLQSGLRAMAIPLSRVNSVGALLQTGDYVDVLLSLEENDGLNPIVVTNPNAGTSVDGSVADPYISIDAYVNNTTVKVVVQNVQVLATISRSTDDAADQNGAPQPDLIVVLAVTPQQAEVVRFAQLDGNVSLVLRASGDADAADTSTTGITLKQLVDYWGVLPPNPVTP